MGKDARGDTAPKLSKRDVLVATGAAIGVLALPDMVVGRQAVWPDPVAARAIAAAAYRDHPGADLFNEDALSDIIALMNTTDGRVVLANRVQQDFALSRTCVVDGWLLSRTEVQLCAASSLAVS